MDLRRLHYFAVITEEGNVGRAAARRLNMSQPPLSQRIRELEAELGCSLFVPTPQGMSLTAPGEVLLVEARRLLAGIVAGFVGRLRGSRSPWSRAIWVIRRSVCWPAGSTWRSPSARSPRPG